MIQPNDYLIKLMEELQLPGEARSVLMDAGGKLMEQHCAEMQHLCDKFMEDPAKNAESVFKQLDQAAEVCGIHTYTASFVFLCWNAQEMQKRYHDKGISEEIFHDTIMDLNYKLTECHQVYNIWGTFVRNWFSGFFALTRFALGRLQYEFSSFQAESYTAAGVTIHKGDRVLTMHIPSSGPLTQKAREDSYRRAYEFYKNDFAGNPVIFTCSSWLLYPPHEQMFPMSSNIVSFMHDFDIIYSEETSDFDNAWRIYGADGNKPADQLPRNTSIQRAYADWLQNGNKAGWGYGVFLFDGRRFVRRSDSSEHL